MIDYLFLSAGCLVADLRHSLGMYGLDWSFTYYEQTYTISSEQPHSPQNINRQSGPLLMMYVALALPWTFRDIR